MGQIDSKSEPQSFKSTVGNQIYDLTRDYIDSCATLTDEYRLCKPFYYFVTAAANGQIRNCTGDCVRAMQEKFNTMLTNGQKFGTQWPFFAQIRRASDSKEYIVPLKYNISFTLHGPDFRQRHRVYINVPRDDRYIGILDMKALENPDKIFWNSEIQDIMYQFANQTQTTEIVTFFTDPTIKKDDTVVVTKLLDSKNQEIDFPLDRQRITPERDDPDHYPDDWYITLTIVRPQNLPLPQLTTPRLLDDDIVPDLPAQVPLYANRVVRRPLYRRRR